MRARIVIEQSEEEQKEGAGRKKKARLASLAFRLAAIASGARQNLNRKVLIVSMPLVGVAIVAMIWLLTVKPQLNSEAPQQASMQILQLASWKAEPKTAACLPRFSCDGRMVAFSSTKSGYSNIWIKQIAGGEPVQITRGEWTDQTPIWSPDGQQIAFISDRSGQDAIWVCFALGDPSSLVKTIEGVSKQLKYWSRDGKTIYYEMDTNLYALDLASKQTTRLTDFDATNSLSRDFSISPDEGSIAYANGKDGQFDIWTRALGGGAPRQITDDAEDDLYPTWHPDGKRIVYSSNRGGAFQVCVAKLDGSKIEQVTFGDTDSLAPQVSPDGAKIIYNSLKEECDLWAVRADSIKEIEMTSDVGMELWPDASPDGSRIAFQAAGGSERLNDASILVRQAASGQTLNLASCSFDPQWSPDGGKIAFLRFSGGMFNLWVNNATGGEPVQLTTNGMRPASFRLIPTNRIADGGYSWSPDSSRIAYCAGSTDNRNIIVISADGATSFAASNNSDADFLHARPHWSRDGTRLASIIAPRSIDKNQLWSLWVSGAGNIFASPSCTILLGWSATGDSLIVASSESKDDMILSDVTLFEVSTQGASRVIAQLKSAYIDNLELSPDGKHVAFASRQDGKDNVWIVPVIGGGQEAKLTTNSDPRIYFSTLSWSPDAKTIYYGKQTMTSHVSMIENFR